MEYFSFNLELRNFFVIDMFDTLLFITLFLLASLLVCLLKDWASIYSLIADINGFLEIPTPSPPCSLNLTKISEPTPLPVY